MGFDDENSLNGLDYWRLCDELNIVQAALLIAGSDPGNDQSFVENWPPHERPTGYDAAKTAITNALRSGKIDGKLIPHFDTDINGNRCGPIDDTVDIQESRIEVESLKIWLKSRGLKGGFFFPTQSDDVDYLDQTHPRYAPKLAAAVKAWIAVGEVTGKTPKQSLVKWLREHAAEFDLSDDEGKPNETGIEEAAKVANWQPAGGAPRTPGS
jgi:hypothetical protein